jgi:hypothetical protein
MSSPPLPSTAWIDASPALPRGVGLAPGRATVDLVLHAAPGTSIVAGTPVRAHAELAPAGAEAMSLPEPRPVVAALGGSLQPLAIPVHVAPREGAAAVELVATIDYVAAATDARPVSSRAHVRIPIELVPSGGAERISYRVELPGA